MPLAAEQLPDSFARAMPAQKHSTIACLHPAACRSCFWISWAVQLAFFASLEVCLLVTELDSIPPIPSMDLHLQVNSSVLLLLCGGDLHPLWYDCLSQDCLYFVPQSCRVQSLQTSTASFLSPEQVPILETAQMCRFLEACGILRHTWQKQLTLF